MESTPWIQYNGLYLCTISQDYCSSNTGCQSLAVIEQCRFYRYINTDIEIITIKSCELLFSTPLLLCANIPFVVR